MKFKLDTNIPFFEHKISYEKKLIFIGSCFSDEVSAKFRTAGFDTLCNPFGTIFHPIALARNIEKAISNVSSFDIFESNKSFYAWDCSSLIQAQSVEELNKKLIQSQAKLIEYLKESSHLFLTFGTSFAYHLKENNYLVANCHKQTAALFEKKISEISEMETIWKALLDSLQQINPKLEIVFTVSPVRHAKDGLLENNRSKARLFELISRLENGYKVSYFPSFEIVVDELRDYRFFKEDLVHPNQMATDFIWEKVKLSFLDESTNKLSEEVEKLRKLDAHLVQTENFEEKKAFEMNKKAKIQTFLENNKQIVW